MENFSSSYTALALMHGLVFLLHVSINCFNWILFKLRTQTVLNFTVESIWKDQTKYDVFLFRGNNVTDMKEIAKLKCLPLLRALLLMGKLKPKIVITNDTHYLRPEVLSFLNVKMEFHSIELYLCVNTLNS